MNQNTNHIPTTLTQKNFANANSLHPDFRTLHRQTKQMQIKTGTKSYSMKLQSVEWQLKRKGILARDGYQCRNCSSIHNLQVHHKQYHKFRITGTHKNPWNYPNQLLITLCNDCHRRGHQQHKIKTIFL